MSIQNNADETYWKVKLGDEAAKMELNIESPRSPITLSPAISSTLAIEKCRFDSTDARLAFGTSSDVPLTKRLSYLFNKLKYIRNNATEPSKNPSIW